MLSSVRYHHQAELLLAVLCAGGVFDRFPSFGVVMAEIGGLAWIPNALQWMDAHVTDPSLREMQAIEPWTHDLLPSEYARRQLRVAPLPNESQSPLPWLDQLLDFNDRDLAGHGDIRVEVASRLAIHQVAGLVGHVRLDQRHVGHE